MEDVIISVGILPEIPYSIIVYFVACLICL